MRGFSRQNRVWGFMSTVLTMAVVVSLTWGMPGAGLNSAQAATPAEILDMACAKAPVVVVVPSMDQLSKKVSQLNDLLGLADPNLGDLAGAFRSQTGMHKGLDGSGAMMLVMQPLTEAFSKMKVDAPNGESPEFVVLVPVSDYGAFVGNFEGGDAGAAVTEVVMRGGQKSYLKSIPGYAVLGRTEKVVSSYESAKQGAAMWGKAKGLNADFVGKADAWVMVNMYAMSERLAPKIAEMFVGMKAHMGQAADQMAANGQAMDTAMTSAVFDMYAAVAQRIASDATVLSLSIDLNETGLGLNYVAQFKPDSYLGKIFPNSTATSSLLARLPAKPYLMAMGMNLAEIDIKTLMGDALANLPEDNAFMDLMGKKLQPVMEKMLGMASVYYAPENANMFGGGGMFTGLNVIETTNGKEYVAAMREYFEAINGLAIPMGVSQITGDPMMMSYSTSYTPAALEVDGRAVDMYQMQYNFPPEVMAQMGQMGPMFMMMGGQGQQGYISANEDFVVMTTSPDALLIQKGLNAVEQQSGIGSDGPIVAMREGDALTPNAMMEMFFSVSGIMNTVDQVVAGLMGGQGLGVDIPADLAPIAMSASVVDHGIVGRYYMDTKTVRTIVDVFYSVRQKFMGGGQGGPGGQGGQGEHRQPTQPMDPMFPGQPGQQPMRPMPAPH